MVLYSAFSSLSLLGAFPFYLGCSTGKCKRGGRGLCYRRAPALCSPANGGESGEPHRFTYNDRTAKLAHEYLSVHPCEEELYLIVLLELLEKVEQPNTCAVDLEAAQQHGQDQG